MPEVVIPAAEYQQLKDDAKEVRWMRIKFREMEALLDALKPPEVG